MNKIFLAIIGAGMVLTLGSCDKMMDIQSSTVEFESDNQLNSANDSVYTMLGILKSMQSVADQTVLLGELRGDLVNVNANTSSELQAVANSTATTDNSYLSPKGYYSVINNCNYYLNHIDTTIYKGSKNLMKREFEQVKTLRAWAYLQLAQIYKSVPYVTEPITTVSQLNSSYPKYSIDQLTDLLVSDLTSDLDNGTCYAVPDYGTFSCGTPNYSSTEKVVASQLCFVPTAVLIGDLYITRGDASKGDYENAFKWYLEAIRESNICVRNYQATAYTSGKNTGTYSGGNWSNIFLTSNYLSYDEMVSVIPMAASSTYGTTTQLSNLFGFDQYATTKTYLTDRQIDASGQWKSLCAGQKYCYLLSNDIYGYQNGDMRQNASMYNWNEENLSLVNKYEAGNIILYRSALIYLRLAEAANRMGHPGIAFAILSEGLNSNTLQYANYLTNEDRSILSLFQSSVFTNNVGIHSRGCGSIGGKDSIYVYNKEIGGRLSSKNSYTLADTVDVMENMIVDELALETAFEGHRYYDLVRIAKHKNSSNPDGTSDYGSKWLNGKLSWKTSIKMSNSDNWLFTYPVK